MNIEKFTDYYTFFQIDINQLIEKIVNNLFDEIIELNQIEQLSEGIDAQGKKIKTLSAVEQGEGNVYSYNYIPARKEEGLQTHNVDLNFTGQFWKTFKVKKVKNGWQVVADFDLASTSILDNFSDEFDFLGLTEDNLEYFVFENILPKLEKKLNDFFK